MQDTTSSGFKILQFRKLNNWKILDVRDDIPMVVSDQCPNDSQPLRTLCTLVGRRGAQRIRIGCCDTCGTIGYIDRPAKEWITRFYADTWDQKAAAKREGLITHEMAARKQQYQQHKDMYTLTSKALHHTFARLDKKRPVLEIGCGYGLNLNRLKDAGFQHVTGIEASVHRAEVTRDLFSIPVYTGNFEDQHIQASLKEKGPFGLIYSHHVLEHIYDPYEMIRLSASLQKEGDTFIVTLPNMETGYSLSTLLFLPHLYTFTKQGLRRMLARFGYVVIDDSFSTPYELCLIAEKRAIATPPRIMQENPDHFGHALKKFTAYFSFSSPLKDKKQLFWCSRDLDVAGWLPFFGNTLLTRAEEILISRILTLRHKKELERCLGYPIRGWRGIISLVATPLETHYVSFDSSPLEIHFDGNIKLSYK